MRTSVYQAVIAVALMGPACHALDDTTVPTATRFKATLSGVAEVPVVSPAGAGTATFQVNAAGDQLTYTVTITSPTTSDVRQSHIHVGAAGGTGPVSVWLCGTTAVPGPTGTPTCAIPGTSAGELISGTVAVPAATLAAMRTYGAYANVHTANNGGGEIRGQVIPVVP